MSKKEKNAPQEEQEKTPCPDQPEEVTEEYRPEETAETFTVTREQMEKMEKLAGQLASLNDQHLRLAAEYDNYRKRTTVEKQNIYADATADAIAEILPVADSIDAALQSAKDAPEEFKKGLELVSSQLLSALAKLRVEPFGEQGEPFDPTLHNAVSRIEDQTLAENTIAQVFQKGYKTGEKIIRHAMVQVANCD